MVIVCVKALSDLSLFSLLIVLKFISIDEITIKTYWTLISSDILLIFLVTLQIKKIQFNLNFAMLTVLEFSSRVCSLY